MKKHGCLLNMLQRGIVALALMVSAAAYAVGQTHAGLANLLKEQQVHGCFVLYDIQAERFIHSDAACADKRFPPASTFKVLNSLIALETRVITPREIIRWDRQPQPVTSWQQDMNIAQAIKTSNVPFFQNVARRIGLTRMQAWVKRAGYGNEEIGPIVDRFWLDGPLMISANEQVKFLSRLAQRQLPFRLIVQQRVRELLFTDQLGAARLYAKTGWASNVEPAIGWFVGWVERDGRIFSFALNLTVNAEADLNKRRSITLAALKLLNVL